MPSKKIGITPDIPPPMWALCPRCYGMGTSLQKISPKVQRRYDRAYSTYEKNGRTGTPPIAPEKPSLICQNCMGSGLVSYQNGTSGEQDRYPHVAIIGGGISGIALAVACCHRGIPFTLYERDKSFDARSQGYGITLQQAHKAMASFGISELKDGIRTKRHLVHDHTGKVMGEWGKRKQSEESKSSREKQKNIHLPRQSLRHELLTQLHDDTRLCWGHRLLDFTQKDDGKISMIFEVDGMLHEAQTDLLVGADGIRSRVRAGLLGDIAPLQYTGLMVILGICALEKIKKQNPLLDGETVFQTVNGRERIYMMPYTSDSIMWQMSFPMTEDEARQLSASGPDALKQAVIHRTPWHEPIPEIISATSASEITGYPIYDRELLTTEHFKEAGNITLMGDAAHPMSPFKGQGANRALLDALALAREISSVCGSGDTWRNDGIRKSILEKFEYKMIAGSTPKVLASAEAGRLLHSEAVLHHEEVPRGRGIKLAE